jgi:hypothetical protein
LLVLILSCSLYAGTEDRLPVRQKPETEAPVQTLLFSEQAFYVIRIEGPWVQIRQGDATGWLPVGSLPLVTDKTLPPLRQSAPTQLVWDHSALSLTSQGSLDSLIDFAAGNYEMKRKMSHPHYRDRITGISGEWGPLFYRKTRHYYVRGISLVRFLDDQVQLGFAKRRLYFGQILGSLWSDEFLRTVVDSNSGWLGNRSLFDKGREYFIDLSFHF